MSLVYMRLGPLPCTLGYKNGGGCGNLSKVQRLVWKCSRGTRKRLFSVVSCFLQYPSGILETQELFPRIYFTHKTKYMYLSLFKGCWNVQENLDSEIFWAGDGRFCGNFPPFCVLAPRDHTCQLCYCTKELHFLRRIFWANKKSGNFGPQKFAMFLWNPPIPFLHLPIVWLECYPTCFCSILCNYWATMKVPSINHHQHHSFDQSHEAKTHDLHAFISDNSTRMVLSMGIRSVQIQFAAAHQNHSYNNYRVHQTTHSTLIVYGALCYWPEGEQD